MNQVLENLIYCLNATIPVFLLMLLGVPSAGGAS